MYEYYLVDFALNLVVKTTFKKKYIQKKLKKAYISHGPLTFDSHHKNPNDGTKLVFTNYLIDRKFVPSEKDWNLYSEIKPNTIKEYLVITVDNQAARPDYKFIPRPAKIAKWDGEKFDVESNESVILYRNIPTVDMEEFLAPDFYQGE